MARFFRVPNQTTPTWREKARDLGKISPQTPEYMEVFNVRYMHALDAVYEDQQKELSGWITKVKEIKNELRNTTMEFYLANQERSILRRKLTDYRQEMDTLLQDPQIWKRVKKMNKGRNLAI